MRTKSGSERIARTKQQTCDFCGVVQIKLAVCRAAVYLNGFFADAEVFGNLLVAHAVGDHADHFAFALRELHQAAAEGGEFHFRAAVVEVVHHGAADGGQKTLIVDGLLQEVNGAEL